MPIIQGYTTKKGKRVGWYSFGISGKRYPYTLGNKKSRERAKSRAKRQGRAIKHDQSLRGK